MKWTAPKIVEVPVGMEINMYACATRRSMLKMHRTGWWWPFRNFEFFLSSQERQRRFILA